MSRLDRVIDNEYATLILETTDDGDIYVHTTVYQWNKGIYENLLLAWGDVLHSLRKRGVHKVHAHAPVEGDDNAKTLRFQMMFGFIPKTIDNNTDTGISYYHSEMEF